MGLHKFRPVPSGRMGTLLALATIKDAALLEFGSMGHMLYGRTLLERSGVRGGCRLYSSHIDESDISLGDTRRIQRAAADIIERDRPEVLFLLPSSVPEIIGTDLPAICGELEEEFPDTLIIPFRQGGFDVTYHKGIEEALLLLCQKISEPVPKTEKLTFNIIGSCADFYNFHSDAREICRMLKGAFDMETLCIMTSDIRAKDIKRLGGAHINIVLRQEGVKSAEYLKQQYGTPYVYQRPYGFAGTQAWLAQIGEVLGILWNKEFIDREQLEGADGMEFAVHVLEHWKHRASLAAVGHFDIVQGLSSFAEQELGISAQASWCDSPQMATAQLAYRKEAEWMEQIRTHKGIMMAADDILEYAGVRSRMRLMNTGGDWQLNPYAPPYVGYRGAMNLVNLWINEMIG